MEYFFHGCAAVAGTTVAVWLAQNPAPKSAAGGDAALPKEAAVAYAQRYGTLDSYGQTSIGPSEVGKLIQTPEFQAWHRANADRLNHLRNEARGRPRFYFALLALLALYAATVLPFGTGSGLTLAAHSKFHASLVRLLGETPMNAMLASLAPASSALTVILNVVFFVSMLAPSLTGHGLTVGSLVALLWWCGAFSLGVGYGFVTLLAVVLVKRCM